ncbi:RHO1 GDP-GTP exchange protein 2 [Coemansia interrupta]|uniref:RHO1 GDP-GTP exchange protein 2 n=1 Tax=Coemansia interrupta TaxID=1126814 RepID=A0A9W8LPM1_9FUNG|nr:RHO1 GDP-GTP exchange protein 2 [Coemansia interrupta]
MNARNSPGQAQELQQYGGLDSLEFDRPPPPSQPKRLQRLSRNPQSLPAQQTRAEQQQHMQMHPQQYYQPPAPQQHYQYQSQPQQQQQQQARPQQQQQFYQQQQYASQPYPGGYQTVRPSQSQTSLPLQQRANTLTRNSTARDNYQRAPHQFHPSQHGQPQLPPHMVQQQQQQYGRPSYSYEAPNSPSSRSDAGGGSSQPMAAPQYPRSHSSAGMSRPGGQNMYSQPPTGTMPQRPMGSYPSAMVVGGGMPSSSRIMPSPALINAVAATDVDRTQRERDLANALGRRRPTYGSVSSNGSADNYQSSPSMLPAQPETPFNGNTAMEYGMTGASAMAQGRYRTGQGSQSSADLRVGRSASSASGISGGGYRAGYSSSHFATQRRPLQSTPEHSQLRKQPSAMSMNTLSSRSSNSMRYAPNVPVDSRAGGVPVAGEAVMLQPGHPGSHSAPDLNMTAMKDAINSVAQNIEQHPVPSIPAAYTHGATQQLQHHNLAHLEPAGRASSLSINTDIPHASPHKSDSIAPADGTIGISHQSSHSSSIATGTDTPSEYLPQTAASRMNSLTSGVPETPASGSRSGSQSAGPPPPVNSELVALLKNVKPVYPAMLSLVAKSFYEIISQVLQTRVVNGLEHLECFTGRDAIDAIYAIIRAADRNLAIVVGRALEQQKLFHDVFYEKRLRDDANELYVFDSDIVRTLTRPDNSTSASVNVSLGEDDDDYGSVTMMGHEPSAASSVAHMAPPTINGVFVMLTDCYSPTCSSSQPCYSVTCPRQRSQQDHLRKTAKSNVAAEMKQEKLWSMSVPKEIVKSVSRQELDRQERMYEVFYGEKDYVRDLCILRDLYMKPLHNSDIIEEDRRKNFITKVFKNALAILAENMELHRALERRQKENFICYQVGDVFLSFIQRLEAYLEYCANQPYGMHFLDAEKQNNKRLVDFLEKTDRRPECRKLGVQHFLTRPPTRLARYPLVLKAVLKYTPAGHPDRETIPFVIERIEAMLGRINTETGKAQNRLRLYKVDEKLMCTAKDRNDLRLTDEQRKLVRDSQLRKRGGNDSSIIQVLLLDHMLLMCKVKTDSRTGEEKYTIYKHPIPLQLLTICYPEDPGSMRPRMAARRDSNASRVGGATASGFVATPGSASIAGGSKGLSGTTVSPSGTLNGGSGAAAAGTIGAIGTVSAAATGTSARPTIIPIDHGDSQKDKYTHGLQITHLGRRGFTVTLYANKLADRQQWYQCIEQQQLELMDRYRKFEMVPVACQFPPGIRVNTADVYDQGRGVVIGTDRGLYVGVAGKPRSFQLLSHLRHDRVFQIEIQERLNVLAMIADKDRNLYVYPLDQLLTATTNGKHNAKVKPLHTHVSFFRFGQYQEMDILCSVKSTTLSNQTIIHVYKPSVSTQKTRTFGRFLSIGGESAADSWKCIKECYIAAESTSLHFLRSRLCVGCSRGFEIVDLATMNTQSLLDPADKSLEFINKRDNCHPIALFRVHDGQFLLCYDEFAFYVNRNGQRAQSNWKIYWVGTPTSFKFEYPYILAFDSQFIEVYHVETAAIVQVIITGNCTSLSPNKPNVNLCVTSPSHTQSQEVLRIQHLLAKDPL